MFLKGVFKPHLIRSPNGLWSAQMNDQCVFFEPDPVIAAEKCRRAYRDAVFMKTHRRPRPHSIVMVQPDSLPEQSPIRWDTVCTVVGIVLLFIGITMMALP